MTIPMKTVKSIEALFSDFARGHIVSLPGLGKQTFFPEDLWAKMGRENLLNPALFNTQDLESHSCLAITRAARALVNKGGNLGMALSWTIHHLLARYLLPPGSMGEQKFLEPLFKAMGAGKATLCFAVSEPKAGAHPKYLAARAAKSTTGFILNGEKTYLTNGSIAQAFIVVAVTGETLGKKQFSAFFVPRETQGLTVLPPMKMPFFNPSPHNGIVLKECRVPANALLGREGQAYGDMVLNFKRVEDAAMTGPVTGAMGFLLGALARAMGTMDHKKTLGNGGIQQLGELGGGLETADLLSWNAAIAVDNPITRFNYQAILLGFKSLVAEFVGKLESLVEEMNLALPAPCEILIRDLKSSARMGKNMSDIQQYKLGLSLLEKK